ncbi:hypothetical protein ACP70R_009169 [Stipagrostis hirtigluma subsp. patula]
MMGAALCRDLMAVGRDRDPLVAVATLRPGEVAATMAAAAAVLAHGRTAPATQSSERHSCGKNARCSSTTKQMISVAVNCKFIKWFY